MSKYNKFEAIGKFFGEAQKPLSTNAYETYKAKYGSERAEGYLQAIKDVAQTLDDITRTTSAGNQKIKSDVDKLYAHTCNFLEKLKLK